eukprot:3280444-Pyramimonas_sp.AAC.1
MSLLSMKGFHPTLVIFLFGFLHLLYHGQAIAFMLGLMLSSPAIHPSMSADEASSAPVVEALREMWMCTRDFFSNKRIFRRALISIEGHKPTKATKICTKNPMNWVAALDTDVLWYRLCDDTLSGSWYKAARALRSYLDGVGHFYYGPAMQRLQDFRMGVYTGKSGSYNSIHLLRCIRFGLGMPAADSLTCWGFLSTMGLGPKAACKIVFGDLKADFTYRPA